AASLRARARRARAQMRSGRRAPRAACRRAPRPAQPTRGTARGRRRRASQPRSATRAGAPPSRRGRRPRARPLPHAARRRRATGPSAPPPRSPRASLYERRRSAASWPLRSRNALRTAIPARVVFARQPHGHLEERAPRRQHGKRREEPPCVLLDHGQVAHLERAAPPDARGTRRRRAREERRLDARRELPYTLDVPRARPALDLARLRLVGEKRG